MALYCFSSEFGKTIEEWFPWEKRPEFIEKDGVIYYRDKAAELSGHKQVTSTYPKICEASGVAEEQAPEVNADIRKHGLKGVECLEAGPNQGCMRYESHEARRRYLKHAGLRDRSSFY